MSTPRLLALALVALAAFFAGATWVAPRSTLESRTSTPHESNEAPPKVQSRLPATPSPSSALAAETARSKLPTKAQQSRQPVLETPPAGTRSSLFEDLAELESRGGLDRTAHRELLAMLVDGLLRIEDPLAAHAALVRHSKGLANDEQLFARVAKGLTEAGHSETGLDIYLELMRRNPLNDSYAVAAIGIDATQALFALRAYSERWNKEFTDFLIPLEAKALIRLGLLDEARELLEAQLASHATDRRALDVLNWIAPEATRKRLRALVDADPTVWAGELALALENEGDPVAAATVLLEGLAASPGDEDLLEQLLYTEPGSAFSYFNEHEPKASEAAWWWVRLGDALQGAGLSPEAIQAWSSALIAGKTNELEGWDALAEYAPSALVEAMETKTKDSGHPSSLGWLAEAYWIAGQEPQAIATLKKAASLSPYPQEWLKMATMAEAGESPF